MKLGSYINRIIVWAVTVCTLAGIAGCYDDSELRALLENRERRLVALEQECSKMNTNIASLQVILNALQENDYISSTAPIVKDGKTIGYTLTFTHRGTVTVYHGQDGANGLDGKDGKDGQDGKNGKDGKSGSVPRISVRQDVDGVWYWTLNGEWMLDVQGNKLQAVGKDGQNGKDGKDGQDGQAGKDGKDGQDGKDGKDGQAGKDGKDGKDGVTPLLKIENNAWYYSYDEGASWTWICEAVGPDGKDGIDGSDGSDGRDGRDGRDGTDGTNGTDGKDGKDGDTIFRSITQDAQNVYITLSDGKVFTVPMAPQLSISFWTDEDGFYDDTLVLPKMYDCLTLHYVVTSATNEVVVQTVTTSDMGAYVIPDGEKPLEGIICIRTYDNLHVDLQSGQLLSKVLVIVANKTCTIMHTLVCQESKLVRVDHDRVDIRQEGGKLDFHYQTNTPVSISIPDSASTWCWQVRTKAQMADSIVSVHVEPNNGPKMRRTGVIVSNHFGVGDPATFTFYIYQDCDNEPIVFADSGLKQYLLDNPHVNLNHDSEISKAEAAAVPNLYTLFGTGVTEGRDYRRFNEFQYFTGIDTIPDGGFNKWQSLDSITLPQSITTILTGYGDCRGIFQDCPNLKSIKGKFTQNNAIIYNNQLLRVAPNVVYDGQFIPDGVEIIGSKAGSHIITTELFIPSSVKKIRDKAFDYSLIETVRFAMTTDNPLTGTAYVDSIAETAFNHCFKLKKFIGPMKNGSLRVTRDNLGLCRDTTFYAYAMGADSAFFAIPEYLNVRKIASGAFDMSDESGNSVRTKLKEIGLPTTVNHFRTGAFCNNESIHLWFKSENPPTQVESGAFNYYHEFRVRFPAVMDGDAVNASATDERGVLFQKALNYSTIAYYEPSQWFAQFEEDFITFEDSSLKAKLIENGIDLNGDGDISYREAKAVKTMEALLGSSFQNAPFSAFDEFQCFTGIWTLPAGSFNGWTNLTTITLPKNIGTIDIDFADQAGAAAPSTDQTVFWNCPKLSYIKGKFASKDNKALIFRRTGESTSKLVKVCETIPAFSIPEGVDTIARYCFYHSQVRDVQFAKSLKVIGDCAFEHSAIEIVKFPLGDGSSRVNPDVDTCRVTTVYDRTFAHCYSLMKFEGARVNGKLKVCDYDRVLYRDTTVYAYALGSNVTKVVIPDGKNIKRLADCVFDMSDLNGNPLPVDELRLPEVIALPTGINHIGARTFFNQAKLVQLYFHGSVVPTICGPQALAHVNSDLWVYIPSGASVDDFAKKLNYNQVTTWETWNF